MACRMFHEKPHKTQTLELHLSAFHSVRGSAAETKNFNHKSYLFSIWISNKYGPNSYPYTVETFKEIKLLCHKVPTSILR